MTPKLDAALIAELLALQVKVHAYDPNNFQSCVDMSNWNTEKVQHQIADQLSAACAALMRAREALHIIGCKPLGLKVTHAQASRRFTAVARAALAEIPEISLP